MKKSKTYRKDGFTLRLVEENDFERYFSENFCPLDKEVVRLTGSKETFTKDEVTSFLHQSIEDEAHYLFLIISPDGRIIGESVINEIDFISGSANFRILIFHASDFGNGIGSWAVKNTRDFAFEALELHRLELEVFDFNPRAQKSYLKAGFKVEGRRREAHLDGDKYADAIIMAMLEDEWKARKENEWNT